MKKRRIKFKARYLRWLFSLGAVLILTGIFLAFSVLDQRLEQVVLEQISQNNLTLLRSGSFAVSQFQSDLEAELFLLSQLESIQRADKAESLRLLGELVRDHIGGKRPPGEERGAVVDVMRVSRDGDVLWGVDTKGDTVEAEVNVADREYFKWAQEQEKSSEVHVVDPIIARGGPAKGILSTAAVMPIFYQGQFNGLVFATVPLGEFSKRYIAPLATYKSTLQLLSSQGKVLSSTKPEMVGQEVSECFKEVLGEREGTLVHLCSADLFGEEKIMTTYVPVRIGENRLLMTLSMPYSRVLSSSWMARSFKAKVLLIGAMSLIFFIFTAILWARASQKEAFIDGFRNGRDAKKLMKKKIKSLF